MKSWVVGSKLHPKTSENGRIAIVVEMHFRVQLLAVKQAGGETLLFTPDPPPFPAPFVESRPAYYVPPVHVSQQLALAREARCQPPAQAAPGTLDLCVSLSSLM